jgi:hypothetical protein
LGIIGKQTGFNFRNILSKTLQKKLSKFAQFACREKIRHKNSPFGYDNRKGFTEIMEKKEQFILW